MFLENKSEQKLLSINYICIQNIGRRNVFTLYTHQNFFKVVTKIFLDHEHIPVVFQLKQNDHQLYEITII